MPSEDPINEEANLWMRHETAQKIRSRPMPARIQTLAHAVHEDPTTLAERIPEDTLRRLKYPMIERHEGDGMSSFTHDLGVVTETQPLLATDHGQAAPVPLTQPGRDSHGRFTSRGGKR